MNLLRRFPRTLPEDDRTLLWRQFGAVFVIITLLNLGFYWQRAFRDAAAQRNVQSIVRGWDGLAWYVWMVAAPATLLLVRRNSRMSGNVVMKLGKLAAGSAGIYFVVTNTRYLLRLAPNLWHPPEQDLPTGWTVYWHTQLERTPLDFLTFCGLLATSFAIEHYTQHRRRAEQVMQLELQAAHLQSELARSQLAVLQAQLHPHFLFNAFNAIATLVRQRRNDLAVDMIARLGELLRAAMERIDRVELTLAEEIAFVRCYLDIERVRFGTRLAAEIEADDDALACIVPNLVLQPLVENALKHGVSKRREGGCVWLRARRAGRDRLHITVADNGPGPQFANGGVVSSGIGLRNTASRLRHSYGEDARLEFAPRPGGGALVELDLPWRPAPAEVRA